MKLKRFAALLLALCMTGALSACAAKDPTAPTATLSPTDAPAPTEETTPEPTPQTVDAFIVGATAEILTANRSEYNFDVISGTLSQLAPVWLDGNGEYQPLLCDYETTDSRVWTLTVREGMKWSDGEPVTAEDIKFTLEYLDTQTEGGYASAFESIQVTDERTIVLTLPAADPRELSNLVTLRIMPKHVYEGVEDYTTVANELANIGCGPYRYVRFDPDAGVIEFAANEDYPDGRPTADTVLLKLFDNEDTMYMALKSGEIDMIYKYSGGVSASVIADLESTGKLTLMPVANTANSAVLIFNNSAAPFDNENIRRAVACAIDYDAFRTAFGSQFATAANAGFIPRGSYGFIETPQLVQDPAKAAEYLAAAGCEDTDGDGFVEYNGEKLSFPVMLRSDKPAHARYAELLANNLAAVGIEVTLDVEEVASFREKTEQQQAQTAVITGLTAFGMAKNQGMASLYLWSGNSMGYGQVTDEAYKTLLDRASAAATMDEYKAVAGELQEYYADTLPAVALFWDVHVQAFAKRWSGFVTDGTFGIMNVQSWLNLACAE